MSISNSYATGAISYSSSYSDYSYSGGLVGYAEKSRRSSVIMSNSYFVDSDGVSTYGIGHIHNNPTIINVSQKTIDQLVEMIEINTLANGGIAWSSTN